MRDVDGYETLTVLGSGQFGKVVLVRRNSDRKLFAAKIPHSEDSAARQAARHEAQLLKHLHHVNIVQFIELIENDTNLALVMEYASGGDLDAFLRLQQERAAPLSEPAIMRIFIQIVLALQYLFGKHILHRDLKPKNVMLDGDGIVKLSDFGVSKILQNTLDSAQTITGTPHYMAPELLEGDQYDCKSDVWSLGCVLHELVTFSPPFTGSALGAVVGKILHSEPPPISEQYSSPFRALVTDLLEKDPYKRPSLLDILRSDAVQQHMMQLVSVTTSHQPVILEQFAKTRTINVDTPTSFEIVSPFPNHQRNHNSNSIPNELPVVAADYLVVLPPKPIQSGADHVRQLFFENQAAARRNKERIDQERSRAAVFLNSDDTTPEKLQAIPASVVGKPSPVSLSSRPRSHSSPYEELLDAERRRVQLETKALQERMRAMQTAD
ncbi:Protein of unknown function, DUF547 [Phytophthora oleae]|uniref:non-specific serine/threonine protein kinase n=1 Tax=Phytophthora oleae TaxID=2107226 RepID=A0ABD3FRE5_9STRA